MEQTWCHTLHNGRIDETREHVNLLIIKKREQDTVVIVTGYGQWSVVNNVLFNVVTHITITNQANTQKSIFKNEMTFSLL